MSLHEKFLTFMVQDFFGGNTAVGPSKSDVTVLGGRRP